MYVGVRLPVFSSKQGWQVVFVSSVRMVVAPKLLYAWLEVSLKSWMKKIALVYFSITFCIFIEKIILKVDLNP